MSATGSGAPLEIARFTGRCAATGRALVAGDRVRTLLIEDEPGAPLRRVDLVDGAAPEMVESAVRGEGLVGPVGGAVVASWRWVVRERARSGPALLDDASLFELFEGLDGAEGRHAAFRYLLALMLMRRRVLVLERAERESTGARSLVVRGRGRFGEGRAPWTVAEPEMDDAAIERALEELSLVLTDGGAP